MNRFRKFVMSCVVAVSLLSPLVTSQAGADTPRHGSGHVGRSHTRIYWVYYRTCPRDSWHCYGGYYRAAEAQQAVQWFRHNGYEGFYR